MNLVASLILSLVASSARSFSLSSASFVNPNKPLSAVRQSTALSLSNNDQVGVDFSGAIDNCKKAAAACLLGIAVLTTVSPALAPSQVAVAAESRLIGEIAGSGLVFKDTLNVESFDDPKVKGVTLYISSFQRPLNERIQKDFFSDPGFARYEDVSRWFYVNHVMETSIVTRLVNCVVWLTCQLIPHLEFYFIQCWMR